MAVRGRCRLSKARVIDYKEVVHLWGERGRIDKKKAAGAASREKKKQRTTKKIAARAKLGGREIEAISLEEELGEFHLSWGGGYETVDEGVGGAPRFEEEETIYL